MPDWIQNEDGELWVAAWVVVVVLFAYVLWEYGKYQHPRRRR